MLQYIQHPNHTNTKRLCLQSQTEALCFIVWHTLSEHGPASNYRGICLVHLSESGRSMPPGVHRVHRVAARHHQSIAHGCHQNERCRGGQGCAPLEKHRTLPDPHGFIMNSDVRALCGVPAAMANRILARLVKEEKLIKCRTGGH